jgi:hypothetical protein
MRDRSNLVGGGNGDRFGQCSAWERGMASSSWKSLITAGADGIDLVLDADEITDFGWT